MYEDNPKSVKKIVAEAFSIKEDTASNEEIRKRLQDGGKVTGTNLCMMLCANIIACVGLNAGSMTTCIGAMLLEPLMGSVLMISYSMVSANRYELKKSGLGLLFQLAVCLIASTLFFMITPVRGTTDELMAFAKPTMFEVIVAFVGGIAGIIGQTRKDRFSTIVPGVAIATALMLPLCTGGYAIANLDQRMFTGALYNFIVNFYFISLGAIIVLNLFNIPKEDKMTEKEWTRRRRLMMINTFIMLIPAVIMSLYMLLH